MDFLTDVLALVWLFLLGCGLVVIAGILLVYFYA